LFFFSKRCHEKRANRHFLYFNSTEWFIVQINIQKIYAGSRKNPEKSESSFGKQLCKVALEFLRLMLEIEDRINEEQTMKRREVFLRYDKVLVCTIFGPR